MAYASAANATVHVLDNMEDVPCCVGELLRARNLGAVVHLPPDAVLETLPWENRANVSYHAPGPDDTAVSVAPFGIAETGTLVFLRARSGLQVGISGLDSRLPCFGPVTSCPVLKRRW